MAPFLGHDDPSIRGTGLTIVRELGDSSLCDALRERVAVEPVPDLVELIVAALWELDCRAAAEVLSRLLATADLSDTARRLASDALAEWQR